MIVFLGWVVWGLRLWGGLWGGGHGFVQDLTLVYVFDRIEVVRELVWLRRF